jgi:hypothetical protein
VSTADVGANTDVWGHRPAGDYRKVYNISTTI